MRIRSSMLRKTCPFCGGPSYAEAKLPIPTNVAHVEYDLDNLALLIEKQSTSLLLALIELLPYKNFACRKCNSEFRLESNSSKQLIHSMLADMKPVIHPSKSKGDATARRKAKPAHPSSHEKTAKKPVSKETPPDWEAESLDSLFDYKAEPDGK